MNHLEIGQKQELFYFDEFSPGCCYFLPNGTIIYNKLQHLIRNEYQIRGFQEVKTPIMAKQSLWEISGHWDKYKENMFTFYKNKNDDYEYALAAMNCPKHCQLFKYKTRSYKDLPLRLADCGVLHRHELSGSVTSLTRNYSFCQDDAHIFCTLEQVGDEIVNALTFLTDVYNKFNFQFNVGLSTKPVNYMGSDKQWTVAEEMLSHALTQCGFQYQINHQDGAFYGPKIDIQLKDSLNRLHQCATIQLDFQLPQNFLLKYIDNQGQEQVPVMIHRAIYGSFERFIAILCEHYQGSWPFWLSPFQIKILSFNSSTISYCHQLQNELIVLGYHVQLDTTDLKINKKVKIAQQEQYHYILVIGKKEKSSNVLCVRTKQGELKMMTMDEFCVELKNKLL
jgi:threonyl-tRNA synthetase